MVMAVASMELQYQYDFLDVDEKRIRLLRLIPEDGGEGDPTLKFGLASVSLDQETVPRYFAVSCFWGDGHATATVQVDGKHLQVPKNTEAALKSLLCHPSTLRASSNSDLTEGSETYVWIDAICINQLDASERSKQVSLMRTIYSKAEEVFIWLGDADDRAAEAATCRVHNLFLGCMSRFDGGSLVDVLAKEDARAGDWDVISPLYASPWWNRVWTVQEGFVNRKATCVLGTCSIRLHELTLTAYAATQCKIRTAPTMDRKLAERLQLAATRVKLNEHFGEAAKWRGIPSLEVVKLLEGFRSSDPRDMIYGMMGLVESLARPKRNFEGISVDYTMPPEELFARASTACIEDCNTLEVLQLAVVQMRDHAPEGVPSWALDPSKHADTEPNPHPIRPQVETRLFPVHFIQPYKLERTGDWATLTVSGYSFDLVETFVSLDGTVPNGIDVGYVERMEEIRLLVKDELLQVVDHGAEASDKRSLDTATGTKSDVDSNNRMDTAALTKAVAQTLAAAIYAPNEAWERRAIWSIRSVLQDVSTPCAPSRYFRQASPQRPKLRHAFFITKRGHIGVAVPNILPGDAVCLLHGGHVPFILRKHPDQQDWLLISDAYVYGAEEWVNLIHLLPQVCRELIDRCRPRLAITVTRATSVGSVISQSRSSI